MEVALKDYMAASRGTTDGLLAMRSSDFKKRVERGLKTLALFIDSVKTFYTVHCVPLELRTKQLLNIASQPMARRLHPFS